MRSPIPVSLGFFLVAAAAYLLQLSPVTGVFLMILAAPLWSVFLINAGFVGIAIEAATGFTRRFWLVLPVLWFGGYAAFAAADRIAIANEMRALKSAAAETGRPSAPSPNLLIHDPAAYLGDEIATRLVSGYDVPVVQVATSAGTTAYRFAPESFCGGLSRLSGRQPVLQRRSMGAPTGMDTGCVVYVTEPKAAGALEVFLDKERTSGPLAWRTVLAVGAPDGPRFPLRAAASTPLTWLPMPILGCSLNSGMNQWECVARFGRESAPTVGGDEPSQAVTVLAAALELSPRTTETPTDEARLQQLANESTQEALAAVDRMLAEPLQKEHSFIHVSALRARPSAYSDRAPAMAAVVRRHMGDEDAAATLTAFQILLAGLPDDDFAEVRPILAEVYRQGAELPRDLTVRALMTRLGVRGRTEPGSRDLYRIAAVRPGDVD